MPPGFFYLKKWRGKMIKFNENIKKLATVEFEYSESCSNIYKRFYVSIDGKRSNIVGLKKFLIDSDDIPYIVTANTYFWTPRGDAAIRRFREDKRREEVYFWLRREGFSDEITLNQYFTGRRRGERIGADNNGYFFEKFGEKYHWDKFSDIDIERGRQEIVKRVTLAKNLKKIDTLIKKHPDHLITFDDSVAAGNCAVGTRNFRDGKLLIAAKKIMPGVKKIKAVSVRFLLSVRDDDFTRRAVAVAIKESS